MKITLESKFNIGELVKIEEVFCKYKRLSELLLSKVQIVDISFDKEFVYLCELENQERKWISEDWLRECE